MIDFKYNIENFKDLLLDVYSLRCDIKHNVYYAYESPYYNIKDETKSLYDICKKIKNLKGFDDDKINLKLYLKIELCSNEDIVLDDFLLESIIKFKNMLSKYKLNFDFYIKDDCISMKLDIVDISIDVFDILFCTFNNRYNLDNKLCISFDPLSDNKYRILSTNNTIIANRNTFIEIKNKYPYIDKVEGYNYVYER